MKPYMAYSREGGSREGACLVFAHTVKEAKKEAWADVHLYFTDEYTDMAITLIKDAEYLFEQADPEKLATDVPHVIFAPLSCSACELWGNKLNDEGLCENCVESTQP